MPRYTPRNMDELRTCPRAIQEPAIAQHAEFSRRPQTNHQPQDRSSKKMRLPDSAHAVPSESGETMSKRPRGNHTSAFKAKVALAAIKGDRTLTQLAEQFDVHTNQITSWKAQLEP